MAETKKQIIQEKGKDEYELATGRLGTVPLVSTRSFREAELGKKRLLSGVLDKRITTTKLNLKAIYEPDGRNEVFDFGLKSEKTATKELEQERKQIEKEAAKQANQQAEQQKKIYREFEQRKPTATEMEIAKLSEQLLPE